MHDLNITPARATLADAIAARADLRERRQQAIDSLHRADDVLAATAAELERHTSASAAAEAVRAEEIAAAIRRGGKPHVTLSRAAQDASHGEADARSRHAVAQAARAQLAAELADAESALVAADRAAMAAAVAVIGDENRDIGATLVEAKRSLFAIFDTISAINFLMTNQIPGPSSPRLPPEIGQAIFDAQAIAGAIDIMRPPTIVSAGGPVAAAAGRWRAYLAALVTDATTEFEGIDAPPPPPPFVVPAPPPSWPIVKLTGEAA